MSLIAKMFCPILEKREIPKGLEGIKVKFYCPVAEETVSGLLVETADRVRLYCTHKGECIVGKGNDS